MPPSLYMPALILSGLVGFGVVLLVSLRRKVSPPLVFLYAAIEGVFIGMFSKHLRDAIYPGIVVQAVHRHLRGRRRSPSPRTSSSTSG